MIKTLKKYLNLAQLTSGGTKYFQRGGGRNGSTKSTLFNYIWPQYQIFKQSISQSIDQPINQSINQSINSQSIIQSKQITNQQIIPKKVIVK